MMELYCESSSAFVQERCFVMKEKPKATLMVREDFGETSASSTSWTVDSDAKEVVFALSDASGETTFSSMSPPLDRQRLQLLMCRSTANSCVKTIGQRCD